MNLLFSILIAGSAPAPPVGELIAVSPAESLHVTQWGRGDPVVIVPGIWSSTFAFRKVVTLLVPQDINVVIIEPLGVGSSTKPLGSDYSMSAQARRVSAVLDSLKIHRAIFVGQALSTSMLLRLAVRDPARVRGMISIEGGVTDVSATPGLKRGLALAAVLTRIIPSRGILKARLRDTMEDVSVDRSWITDEVVEEYFKPWRQAVPRVIKVYQAIARSREPDVLSRAIEPLRFPVHLMLGGGPHYGGVTPSERAPIERLPRARVSSVAGAGHLLHEERPDVVAKAVLALRDALAPARAELRSAGYGRANTTREFPRGAPNISGA